MWSLDVKNDIMQLKSLHNFFKNELMGYYPNEEIDAFFYRICSTHLKLKKIDISLKSEMIITNHTFEYFEMVIERLLNYEPIQYIQVTYRDGTFTIATTDEHASLKLDLTFVDANRPVFGEVMKLQESRHTMDPLFINSGTVLNTKFFDLLWFKPFIPYQLTIVWINLEAKRVPESVYMW